MNNSILKIIVVIGSIAATTSKLSASAPSKQSMVPKPAPIAPLNPFYLLALKSQPSRFAQCMKAQQVPQLNLYEPNPFCKALQYPIGSPKRVGGCSMACTSLVTPCGYACLTLPMGSKGLMPIGSPAALSVQCVPSAQYKKDKKS